MDLPLYDGSPESQAALDIRIQQVRARVEEMTGYGDGEHVALAHAVLRMLETPDDCGYGGPDHHEAWSAARAEMITRLSDTLTGATHSC
jgi:hypothetical protein